MNKLKVNFTATAPRLIFGGFGVFGGCIGTYLGCDCGWARAETRHAARLGTGAGRPMTTAEKLAAVPFVVAPYGALGAVLGAGVGVSLPIWAHVLGAI
jgi:hypothetical protein